MTNAELHESVMIMAEACEAGENAWAGKEEMAEVWAVLGEQLRRLADAVGEQEY